MPRWQTRKRAHATAMSRTIAFKASSTAFMFSAIVASHATAPHSRRRPTQRKQGKNAAMTSRKLNRQDLRDAAEKYKNWGKWGPNDEIGTLNYTQPEDIVAAARLVKKGKVISLALNYRRERPAGRQDHLPDPGPHQPAARHAAHRHRRLFRRARQARHSRGRRHGGAAAAERHAVGRARPRVLRELHVERLRLPRGHVLRRAEVRHREDQEQDGRPRRVPRRGAHARAWSGWRTATPSPATTST